MSSKDRQRAFRSSRWLQEQGVPGFLHRASLRATGISSGLLDRRPIIGICNSWSEAVNCNLHFRGLAAAVKRGALAAGGVPIEFPTISLGEMLMKPTTMLYRNLMAMDVEESIRSNPFDAVVLISGCDKTIPAQLMGAASADVPAIVLTGGPSEPTRHLGRDLSVGADLWRYADEVRAGALTMTAYSELEASWIPTSGHCNEMGTASTMACIVEALGLTLPGTASIPAVYAQRSARAEEIGARAVALALEDCRPRAMLTAAAFRNAVTTLIALGGSTNAVIHLLALARRVGYELPLEEFDAIAQRTPVLVNVRPTGEYLFADFDRAGGMPVLMGALAPLLDLDAMTVSGDRLGTALTNVAPPDGCVIRSLDDPVQPVGGLRVLHGNLAPTGALIKAAGATPNLFVHKGPAVVFEGVEDLAARIDDPDLLVSADSVLVLRNAGPVGGPGMPEWGMLPIPRRLLQSGVRDMVRVSDARMSGTASGTCVLHVSPESALGGPLSVVRDGDLIALDVPRGRLDIEVTPAEMEARRLASKNRPRPYARGYGALYTSHVTQADQGCDFDFLHGGADDRGDNLPYGLFSGWVGGW